MSCYGCCRLQEADGVPTWPGWEAILVERFSDELKRLKVNAWKALVAAGELYVDHGTLRSRRTPTPAPADEHK